MKSYVVILRVKFEEINKGETLFTASIKAARNEKHACAIAVCKILEKFDCEVEIVEVRESAENDGDRRLACILGAIKVVTNLKYAKNSRNEEFREGSKVSYFENSLRRLRGKVTEIVTNSKVMVRWYEPDSLRSFEEETELLTVVNDI